MKIYPLPSVKLLTESADWLQKRISHQCSVIVFCKQNACCLVTFHLSLTFSKSYCYHIRFTLSSCDYCNLLNPGAHPSGKGKVGCKWRVLPSSRFTMPGAGWGTSAWHRLWFQQEHPHFSCKCVPVSTRQTLAFPCPSESAKPGGSREGS